VRLNSVSLKDVAAYIKRGVSPKYVDHDGMIVINQRCIRDGRVDLSFARMTDPGIRVVAEKYVRTGDTLINSTGTGTVGRTAHFFSPEGTEKCVVDTHVTIVRPDTRRVNPRWLSYALRRLEGPITHLAKGATNQVELSARDLGNLSLRLPDISEQQRIASTLSAYDDLIETNRRRIALLEASARLLYREWFVHLRFPGHAQVPVIDGVPEGWERKQLGTVAPLMYGKGLKKDDRIPGPYPVYGSSGVIGTHERALVAGRAIVVGRKGNVGSVFWSEEDFFPIDTVYYIPQESSSFHLYYTLRNTQFLNTDAAVPGLNRNLAHKQEILIPSADIHDQFEHDVSISHQQVSVLAKQIKKLIAARDLLLPRLMTGDLAA